MAKTVMIGERLNLRLEDWGRLGEAVAHINGRTIFVFGGVPGEDVVAEIIMERRGYIAAQVIDVIKPSDHRVVPPCRYFGDCTGCQWQHISYEHQLDVKQGQVIDALWRVGGFREPDVLDVIPSPKQFGYRNHARFTIRQNGTLGYVNRETRRFVPVNSCMLMHEGINGILTKLQGQCGETTQLSIRYGVNTGEYLVQPNLSKPPKELTTGQTHYEEQANGVLFRVASPSFFQVNVQQLETIVGLISQRLDLSGTEIIVDAYAGVGTFAVLLAPFVSKVIAIEDSPAAVDDARANAKDCTNVEFILGRAEDALATLDEAPNILILDPPRKGCDVGALEAVKRLAPSHVVYVSCDPVTLARDLKILCAGSFYLKEVQPIDMFPQTHHVECVATLAHRRSLDTLVLASSSPRRSSLLKSFGVNFQPDAPHIDEDIDGTNPQDMVVTLALEKARVVSLRNPEHTVVAADTTVVLDGICLGKPSSVLEAREMLQRLRGREHSVITGFAVVDPYSGRTLTGCCTSTVYMRNYTDVEIVDYIETGDSDDKAGAYAIQHEGFHPTESVDGCYTNVVGLPLCCLRQLLDEVGYDMRPFKLPDGCVPNEFYEMEQG
ncbi:23S rRNA (uracil(1939)-C(5))-methyltransferase RlmD [SAR202 cluster bacterium AD-804-J14_MRT_500m]|nr:23S rRNA (uracil(1939)-C(5))-methyltransferase RlmD [SAR202 cluster bacterium AD-804-J14_MRT_500m]